MGVYNIGQEVRYYGTFADVAGTAYDPGTVRFVIAPPTQPGTYYLYGGGTVLKQNTGTYYTDVILTRGGYWQWGWEGTGTITTTDYGRDFARYATIGTT
jgi:hypothetical protein